jgi:hypothetical protein
MCFVGEEDTRHNLVSKYDPLLEPAKYRGGERESPKRHAPHVKLVPARHAIEAAGCATHVGRSALEIYGDQDASTPQLQSLQAVEFTELDDTERDRRPGLSFR